MVPPAPPQCSWCLHGSCLTRGRVGARERYGAPGPPAKNLRKFPKTSRNFKTFCRNLFEILEMLKKLKHGNYSRGGGRADQNAVLVRARRPGGLEKPRGGSPPDGRELFARENSRNFSKLSRSLISFDGVRKQLQTHSKQLPKKAIISGGPFADENGVLVRKGSPGN